MISLASSAAVSGQGLSQLPNQLTSIAKGSYVSPEGMRLALAEGWAQALDRCLEDGILSKDEEAYLQAYARAFSLTREELDKNGAATRAIMARALREILSGNLPRAQQLPQADTFNLQQSEQLVWTFPETAYYEERIRRSYVGGSTGMSIRLAKGVYYRVGAFKGHPIEKASLEQIDTGVAAATTKHIYFAGGRKSFRVPYNKIVNFTPYSDGLGFCKDAASAKPQILVTGDGWFIYNLVRNLAAVNI